jgi:GT2 family glycosyltransferase
MTSLTTIIVSYNTCHLLDTCLESLHAAEALIGGGSCIVVDNASRDGSADHLAKCHPEVELIRLESNHGFGRANNVALERVRSPHILLLNTDALMDPAALSKALAYLDANPQCGILGGRLCSRDGRSQPSARRFPTPLGLFVGRTGLSRWIGSKWTIDPSDLDPEAPQECDWVPGCFFLIRKSVIESVGGFDPRFFLYCEEVDFCIRAKSTGWQVHYFPEARITHVGGESARADGALGAGSQIDELSIESYLLHFRKHFGRVGLLSHAALEWLAEVVISARSLFRKSGDLRFSASARRLRMLIEILLRTHFGARATR